MSQKEKKELSQEEIVYEFKRWSEDKANRYSEEEIVNGIEKLFETEIIEKTLMGYTLSQSRAIHS